MLFLGFAVLVLELGLTTSPAAAFDMLDVRYFRETGYRWCRECNLSGVNLEGTILAFAAVQGADLSRAILERANLTWADLTGADLSAANLEHANLSFAKLSGANLTLANLAGASLTGANLSHAIYAPASSPPGHVASIWGLTSVIIKNPGDVTGLVQLRKLLQEAGLPEEREATYAIERNKTLHLLFRREPELVYLRSSRVPIVEEVLFLRWDEPLKLVEGFFRFLAFEWPVRYGCTPAAPS